MGSAGRSVRQRMSTSAAIRPQTRSRPATRDLIEKKRGLKVLVNYKGTFHPFLVDLGFVHPADEGADLLPTSTNDRSAGFETEQMVCGSAFGRAGSMSDVRTRGFPVIYQRPEPPCANTEDLDKSPVSTRVSSFLFTLGPWNSCSSSTTVN